MINSNTVCWIDDEPNLMDAELFDLENNDFVPIPFQWVGHALSWVIENAKCVPALRAIVVDIQLPSRGDNRFTSEAGVPVGVRFCEALAQMPAIWAAARPKIILYTRLPSSSPVVTIAKNFAKEQEIAFRQKTAAARVAIELIEESLLKRA